MVGCQVVPHPSLGHLALLSAAAHGMLTLDRELRDAEKLPLAASHRVRHKTFHLACPRFPDGTRHALREFGLVLQDTSQRLGTRVLSRRLLVGRV